MPTGNTSSKCLDGLRNLNISVFSDRKLKFGTALALKIRSWLPNKVAEMSLLKHNKMQLVTLDLCSRKRAQTCREGIVPCRAICQAGLSFVPSLSSSRDTSPEFCSVPQTQTPAALCYFREWSEGHPTIPFIKTDSNGKTLCLQNVNRDFIAPSLHFYHIR